MQTTTNKRTPETEAWLRKHRALVQAGRDTRVANIRRIMARHELETDEGGTAWDKAEAIYRKESAA